MNADFIRQMYDYHFTANHMVWDMITTLTGEQFTQPVDYSIGSIRNHAVHLMHVDHNWFAGLRGEERPGYPDPTTYTDRDAIRAEWDTVEEKMHVYLSRLTDAMLLEQPFAGSGRGDNLLTWQVLVHVVNHGTDHRAQMLRLLNEQGVETGPQDFFYHLMGRL